MAKTKRMSSASRDDMALAPSTTMAPQPGGGPRRSVAAYGARRPPRTA